jgi:acyl-[acyl carrier protein]--UDP-N-acetylglucosamine O-acyltransferase
MYRYLLNSFKNIKIGENNTISKSAKIHENVIIGNNNKIYDDVIIYPNTIIGDNNIILNNNIIGEYPIQSSDNYRDYKFDNIYGTKIGNNNFFHVRNIIFGGTERNTEIKDNNKILGECHIGHDSIVNNNITIYSRTLLCGYVELLDYSSSGVYSFVHQYKIVGQYSMIGGNSSITKNVFPYFINIDNKISKINKVKLPEKILQYENELRTIADEYYKGNKNFYLDDFPDYIKTDLKIFLYKLSK